ncbi:MAG: hypothetical protein HQK53_06590 [Oligoflexia bacterium]|nr:hypothetical protein [Oligoflexia bacterium]
MWSKGLGITFFFIFFWTQLPLANIFSATDAVGNKSKNSINKPDPAKFVLHKQKLSENIDKEISILEKEKACVEASNDPSAIQTCRKESKEAHRQMREKMGMGEGPHMWPSSSKIHLPSGFPRDKKEQ